MDQFDCNFFYFNLYFIELTTINVSPFRFLDTCETSILKVPALYFIVYIYLLFVLHHLVFLELPLLAFIYII